MNRKMLGVLGASAVALSATPAMADDYVFGFSDNTSPWTLTINGTDYTSIDTGWIRSDGNHDSGNNNYITGQLGIRSYNNYGVFDLSNLSGPVNSAVLSLKTFGVLGGPSLTYSLFDTTAGLAALDATRNGGDLGGIALHADLGSGVTYGSRVYTAADSNLVRSITLNGSALSAIQTAAGRQFALGGTLRPGTSAVPEPAAWAMMLVGFGMVGAFMRRKPKMTTRLSYN